MSFKVFKVPPKRSNRELTNEFKNMLEKLSEDPENLTAKIDVKQTDAHRFANKLGYKISTTKIDSNHCFVWIRKAE